MPEHLEQREEMNEANEVDQPKDRDVRVHRLVLCVAVCAAVSLPISGWFWVHAMGWRSTRVVEEIERTQLDERYTIPAHKRGRYVPIDMGFYHQYWVDAQVVRYENWRVVSVDGFAIEIDRVDPKDPPEITHGQRYTGWWK